LRLRNRKEKYHGSCSNYRENPCAELSLSSLTCCRLYLSSAKANLIFTICTPILRLSCGSSVALKKRPWSVGALDPFFGKVTEHTKLASVSIIRLSSLAPDFGVYWQAA